MTFPYANTYLTIYTLGTFFALVSMGMNYFITAQGFPFLGMATTLIGAVVNIVLDPIFILYLKWILQERLLRQSSHSFRPVFCTFDFTQ